METSTSQSETTHVKLKVSNLPSDYLELTFKGILGRYIDRSLKSTWCIQIERQMDCAVVTVLNKNIAELLIEKSIKYYSHKLDINLFAEAPAKAVCVKKKKPAKTKAQKSTQHTAVVNLAEADNTEHDLIDDFHDEIPHETMGSCLIKVKGISPPFVKDILLPYLEEERRERGIDPDVEIIITGCGEYNEEDKSVVLRVVTDRQAIAFTKLGRIEFFKDNLTVSLVNPEEAEKSTFLKISGIPPPFVEALFLPFLEDARRSAGIEPDIDISILSYGEFDNEERSVIFQFLTFEIVEELCKLKSIVYLKRHTLSVSKSEKQGLMIEPTTTTLQRIQSTVNVPKSTHTSSPNVNEFASSSFQSLVNPNKSASSSGFLSRRLTPSGNEDSHTASSSVLQSLPLTPSGNEDSHTASSSGLQSLPLTPSQNEDTASSSAELQGNRTDWTTHTELQLLKLMLINKKLLNHSASRFKGEGNRNIITGMKTMRFNYTESSIRKRMKGLLAYPPKLMEDIVKEFEGKLPDGSTQVDDLLEKHPDIVAPAKKTSLRNPQRKYSDFVVVLDNHECKDNSKLFPDNADTVLLNAYLSLKHKFDDDMTRSDQVYAEMLNIMHTGGYTHLRAEDLSTRIGSLAGDFKLRYDSMLNQTGSGTDPQMWPHYDVLSRIYEKSSIFEPQKIMSFGSSFANFSRKVQLYTKPSTKQTQEGKRQSKFLGERHDENLQVKKQMVEQMKRHNNLLEKRMEKID